GLAFGGAGRDGVGDGTDGLAFGSDGSVAPAPGEATGLPWIRELHPLINAALISRPASSRPLTLAVFALSQNISETSLRTK
ncbi:MAG TPA: hypothetical protein VG187_06700, partial [Mycobacterium sp.]|nr:hypothetical protein [Mycobacterium sp.]